MKTFFLALLVLASLAQTLLQAQQTGTPATTVVSSSTSATMKPKEQERPKPSKALRIFFESRNVNGRPEGYETLLSIEENGNLKFEFHTVSNRRDSIRAKLKPRELQALIKSFNAPKFFAAEPEQRFAYADWMQSLTVEKDEKAKTIRFMVDIRKPSKEAVEKHIQEQLGAAMTKDVWKFVQLIRALNDRFKFQ
ncbi:MAG: hypothetical protein MUF71_04605 [Candidatus Kapabacteria bacterium]|jgi:hypothetical protein|nr:hypothetical protein [Candidatus Kapabacteria bacterium]